MHALDRPLEACRALVVDPNPTSRSILAAQLRDFGIGQVAQTSRLQDARRQLESQTFEFVLCEQAFPNEAQSGPDLLDDLRRAQLLPFSTVFLMITAEATYHRVAEAAESALDGYLLKPHTATSLAERLRTARERKRVLREVFEAIEAGEFETAARACLQRFRDRAPYWLYAARIGAELLLRLQMHDAAQKLYEAVTQTRALPWARLGIARAQLAARQPGPARRTLESLLTEQADYADAYDVMGRLQVEQGQLGEALETYRRASDLTPASLTRLQKRGMLAHYLGQHEEAAQVLERAAAFGISSRLFDPQSLVLLAFARWRQRDTRGLQRCLENLVHAREKAEDAARLDRYLAVVRALAGLATRQVAAVLVELRALAAQVQAPDFDIEAGCNLLGLLAAVAGSELQLDEADDAVDRVAWRFAGSRAGCELLAHAVAAHPPFAQRVRDRHADLLRYAEESLAHSLGGDPASAIAGLIDHARRTCNARLVETAALTLQRYRERLPAAAELDAQIHALRERTAADLQALPLVQDGVRASGGVALRTPHGPSRSPVTASSA